MVTQETRRAKPTVRSLEIEQFMRMLSMITDECFRTWKRIAHDRANNMETLRLLDALRT